MPVIRRGRDAGPDSSGRRDRYVLIQWRPAPDDVEASGLPKDDWSDYRSVYMSRGVMAFDERFVADQISATEQMVWQCEYLADLDPDVVDVPKRVRLIYGGRPFNVLGASVIGRGRAIEFITSAGTTLAEAVS